MKIQSLILSTFLILNGSGLNANTLAKDDTETPPKNVFLKT